MWIPTDIGAREQPEQAPQQAPDQPLYRAIANSLERAIADGSVAAGERLPTHRALARALGVNVMTITRAYAEAARRGLVSGEVGRGTFVRTSNARSLVPLPVEETDDACVDLGFNLPVSNRELLDTSTALREIAAAGADDFMQSPGALHGRRAHRAAGADWIRRSGLGADTDRTVVTSGAQHALTIALGSLCAPGDVVLTGELTYPGIRTLATVLHVRLEGVAMDADGLLPDALDAAGRKFNAKVAYLTPTIQNPTGSVMSRTRREELAVVCRRLGLTIIEDDANAFACGKRPAPPLASFAPELSYYLTSLGKCVAPGLRVGYLLAPAIAGPTAIAVDRMASNMARLANVTGTTWTCASLMAELATRWIKGGTADAVVNWKREEIARRRDLFAGIFPDRVFPDRLWAAPTSHILWLEVPRNWTSEELGREARRHGVALIPTSAFRTGAGAPDGVRLCLATPTERVQLEKALRILASILECAPGSLGLDRVPRVPPYAGPFG